MPHQTWNAALFLLARHGLAARVFQLPLDIAWHGACFSPAESGTGRQPSRRIDALSS